MQEHDDTELRSLAAAGTLPAAEVEERPPPREGDLVSRYALRSELGRGGMGVVYRAFDPQLEREVALKLLVVGEGTHGRARLLREARATAKVRHPNVVAVHDAGEFGGRVFVAMELVEGITLRAWLGQTRRSWRDVLEVMIAAGEGLAAAHAAGLVHRDFKPENVMVERSGRVRVLDFGLAREARDGQATGEGTEVNPGTWGSGLASITRSGAIVGTPAYMAPEQYRAEPTDPRTDQFSFCVALYEALVGERPFRGRTPEALMISVLAGKVAAAPMAGLSPGLQRSLRRGLSVDPAARFASMAELLEQLRAELRQEPRARGRRVGVAIASALAIGAGGFALFDGLDAREPEASSQPAVVTAPRVEVATEQAPPVPVRERSIVEVLLPRPAHVRVNAVIALLTPVVTPALSLAEDRAGLSLRGEDPGAWVPVVQSFVSAIDHPVASKDAPASSPVVSTPDGQSWIGLRIGEEARRQHLELLRGAPGVAQVHAVEELPFALVRGEPAILAGARERLAEAMRPKFRRWCFHNSNMGEQRCRDTQAECITDADLWGGPGTGRRSCRGKI